MQISYLTLDSYSSFIYYFNVKTFVSVKKLKDDSHFDSLTFVLGKVYHGAFAPRQVYQ